MPLTQSSILSSLHNYSTVNERDLPSGSKRIAYLCSYLDVTLKLNI